MARVPSVVMMTNSQRKRRSTTRAICSAMYVTAAMADFRFGGRTRQKLSVCGSRWSRTELWHLDTDGETFKTEIQTSSSTKVSAAAPHVQCVSSGSRSSPEH
ncbi:hypothetical protein EYF80_050758 [Liparis tanakae]|uniref:Uncharacterized protein n=1 Tax=Liparis tanakae TaxID=230148 RepID=A0A4Z2FD81_9TELE|nr:hypothetical protein EYF80_050758 [Liparis tanakae]